MDKSVESFAITDRVVIEEGRGGLTRVKLLFDADNQAEVYLNGAHLTSWLDDGRQVLFVSDHSRFSDGETIRGGVPLVFPQFGPGVMPLHGFARSMQWTVRSTEVRNDGTVTLELGLNDDESSRALWDYPFALSYVVELGESLSMTLRAENTGSAAFEFTAALHTYFAVSDIARTAVEGLQGTDYLDNLDDKKRSHEQEQAIRFERRTGRTYLDTPSELSIVDEAEGRRTTIRKDGFPDAVVWNPHIEQSVTTDDLGDEEYKRFVCVEAARVADPVRLEPSQQWEGGQVLSVGKV